MRQIIAGILLTFLGVSIGYGAAPRNELGYGFGSTLRSSEQDRSDMEEYSFFHKMSAHRWIGFDLTRNAKYERMDNGSKVEYQPTTVAVLYKVQGKLLGFEPYLLGGVGVVKNVIYIEKSKMPLYDVTLISPTAVLGIGVLKDFGLFFIAAEGRKEYIIGTKIHPTEIGAKYKLGELPVGDFYLTSTMLKVGIRF